MAQIALLVLILQVGNSSPLVGRWDSEKRSRGGLGSWIELSANGSCRQTIGAMVDGTWKLDGERLTLEMQDADGISHPQTATVSITDRNQTQTSAGQTRSLVRVGLPEPGTSPLVGIWSYSHPAGGQAYEEYGRDARFLFRLPIGTIPCHWSADGERFRIVEKNQQQEFKWRLKANHLVLERSGETQAYRRERANVIGSGVVSKTR